MLHCSVGQHFTAGGIWRKWMVFDGRVWIAMRFRPMTLKSLQPKNGCFRGTSRGVFVIFAGSDHLCMNSLHSLRRSPRSQGLRGLSVRPAAKSSR